MYPDDSRTVSTPAGKSVVVALLGGIATRRSDDGALLPLPGARARSLLVALAAHTGRVRSSQALIDDVWGDQPPRAPMNALHTQMSRLRAALPDGAIEMSAAGYRLTLPKHQVDLALARALEQRAQQLHAEGDHAGCLAAVAQARALWRGDPGADLPAGELAGELAATAAARADALDTVAVAAHLALGEPDVALPVARGCAERAPLDETAHATLMRVLALAGRPSEALEVFAAVRARLADDLGADPGPALVELNTAILRGDLPAAAAPEQVAPNAAPPSIGLRVAPNPLLGRHDDLDALESLLHHARVATVLGPGGTGKTRVANELGQRWAARMPVVLVELASLRSGDDVIASIVSALGLSEVRRAKPTGIAGTVVVSPMQLLRESLGARPTLLILDNCEHLIDAVADVVAELIGGCGKLRVLTTSRAPLMITAESVYPLEPLWIGENGSPATDLFVARAKAVRPSAHLDPAVVAQLCRTLDGLPLAIELAAARVRSMSVEEINAGLRSRFSLLRNGDRTSPQRHRTLHAVIEWSWNLLDVPQQAALRRLCRFPAGFTMAAARTVAGWDAVPNTEDALDGLVNQSLLNVVESDGAGGLRYRMLETVREFGEEQLRAAAEAEQVVARMARWAADFAEFVMAGWATERQVATVQAMHDEQENLLAVAREAMTRPDDADAQRALFLSFGTLGALWTLRGLHSEVVPWVPRILAIRTVPADVPFDAVALVLMMCGTVITVLGELRAVMLARRRLRRLLAERSDGLPVIRFQASAFTARLSGPELARQLAVATRSPDELTRIAAMMIRAIIYENKGVMFESMRDAGRALPIAEARGDIYAVSVSCQHLGSCYAQSAQYPESVGYYQRAVDGLRRLGVAEEAHQHSAFLVNSLVGAGRLAEARRVVEMLGTEIPELSDPADPGDSGTGRTNIRLAAAVAATGELLLAEGDTEAGLAAYRRALVVSKWPLQGEEPGPFGVLLAAGAVCAHSLAGRAEQVDDVVRDMIEVARGQFIRFPDLPQVGSLAVAIGSHGLARGHDPRGCADLIALARKATARQDVPSMMLGRHRDSACAAVGEAAMAAAEERAMRLTRRRVLDEILSLVEQM